MSRLTFVGHSTLLIELDGVRILTDPLLRGRLAHIRRRVPVPAVEDLVPLDAVLISHAHADHLDLLSLRRVAGGATVVVPSGCAALLRRVNAERVEEVSAGQSLLIGTVRVEAVHAEHDSRRHPLARASQALGYLISGTTRLYFAGDTDLFEDMARLAGRVDIACLPVAGWGPRLPAGHLDPAGAARAVALIRPRMAIPIHWGTMRSPGGRHGLDPEAPAREFTDAVAALELGVATATLHPGESLAL